MKNQTFSLAMDNIRSLVLYSSIQSWSVRFSLVKILIECEVEETKFGVVDINDNNEDGV